MLIPGSLRTSQISLYVIATASSAMRPFPDGISSIFLPFASGSKKLRAPHVKVYLPNPTLLFHTDIRESSSYIYALRLTSICPSPYFLPLFLLLTAHHDHRTEVIFLMMW